MYYLKPILYFSMLLLLASCGKDDDKVVSKENLITGKNWKLIAATVDPPVSDGTNPISDIYATLPSCTKDDYIKFNSNGTFTFDEGQTKCTASDPQSETSDWFFNNDKTAFVIEQNNETVSYTILKLTSTELEISFTDTVDDSGDIYTFKTSYTAQ